MDSDTLTYFDGKFGSLDLKIDGINKSLQETNLKVAVIENGCMAHRDEGVRLSAVEKKLGEHILVNGINTKSENDKLDQISKDVSPYKNLTVFGHITKSALQSFVLLATVITILVSMLVAFNKLNTKIEAIANTKVEATK